MFVTSAILLFIMLLLGYLLGSVPFGYFIGVVFFKKNIQKLGSGNVGATNVWRVLGPAPAVATFLLDSLKGGLMVLLSHHLLNFSKFEAMLIGFLVIIGHCYSYLLHFKGGKGVATSFGVLLALAPFTGGVVLLIWGVVFIVVRVSSIAALTAWAFAPILFYYFAMGNNISSNTGAATSNGLGYKAFVIMLAITCVIYVRHYKNIIALWSRREYIF